MLIRASALFLPVMALSSLVAAVPGPVARSGGGSHCRITANLECCNQTYENNPETINNLESLLGIVLNIGSTGGLLGVGCSPISVTGIGSVVSCAEQTVCCTGPYFYQGLVTAGCDNS